jgi:hypothetical protein
MPSRQPSFSCSVSSTTTNLIINGSFETPKVAAGKLSFFLPSQVPGWLSQYGERIEIWSTGRSGIPALDGVNFLELDYRSSVSDSDGGLLDFIYQDVRTTLGQYYEASFYMRARRRTNFNSQDETAIFSWNGVDTAFTAAAPSVWTMRTVIVVGTGGLDRFAIRESNEAGASTGFGPLIDDVRLLPLTCSVTAPPPVLPPPPPPPVLPLPPPLPTRSLRRRYVAR